MKRQLTLAAFCAVFALGGFCLGGCVANDAPTAADPVDERPSASEVQTGTSSQPPQEADVPTSESPQVLPRFNLEGTIEPTVLLDSDDLAIEAKSLEYRNDVAYLALSITNKTDGDIDVMTSTVGYSANYVNGCMLVQGSLSSQVPAHETVDEEVLYSLPELQLYGIQGIGELGLGVRVVDGELNELFKDIVEIKTSLSGDPDVDAGTFAGYVENPAIAQALGYEIKAASSISQGLEGTGFEATSAYLVTNKVGEVAVMVEFQNSSAETMEVLTSDITIDGVMAHEGLWTGDAVIAGKRFVVDDLRLSSMVEEGSENFDLAQIKDISMSVSAVDGNGNTLFAGAAVTLTF